MGESRARVIVELAGLTSKKDRLYNFVYSKDFKTLNGKMQELLCKQLDAMETYESCLRERLKIWKD